MEQNTTVADSLLRDALERDTTDEELTLAISHAKSKNVATDLLWYAEVVRRRRVIVNKLKVSLDPLLNDSNFDADIADWQAICAQKTDVLQDWSKRACTHRTTVLE